MDTVRVYKCQWNKDGKLNKTITFVTKKQFSFLDKKPVSKEFGNTWYEEYPFKWYEFYPTRSFIKNLIRKSNSWHSKKRGITKFLYDFLVLVIGTIVVTAILKFVLNWI